MWFEIVVGAVMLGSYIYHRWYEDHPTQLTPQVTVPRTVEGTPLPLVYGQCRIRSPIAVWAGNYLAPGEAYDPWNRAPDNVIGDNGHARLGTAYSVDILLCLGIPFYSTAAAGVAGPSTLRAAWAGDTPMAMNINSIPGTPAMACYAGKPSGTLLPADIGKDFMFTGIYYRGTWDQSVLDGSTVYGTTPATMPSMQLFFPDSDQTHGLWPDAVYYDYTAAGTSAFAAFKQANADINMPGCRGQIMMFAHVALSQSPALPAFQFEVRTIQAGSAADLGNAFGFDELGVSVDADPASVILDLLTSPWGKVGLSMSQIYLPSFQATSNTLFAEQHGYSRAFEQPADADAMINDVIAQIDAAWYQEPTTGQIVIKLIRFDYDPNTLDDINPDNAEPTGSGWYTIQGWAEVPNQVRVTYRNRADNYAEAVMPAQDASLIESNGGRIRSVNVRYEGCCVSSTAAQLAARELAAVGRPMVRATLMVDRSFYAKRPGDVVTLTWPNLNINKMAMRIAAIDLGVPQSGKIKVSLMRDIFDVKVGAFG
jgi:hypothetical protein